MKETFKNPQYKYSNFHGIITVSNEMREFFKVVERVAKTDASVLVRGQTGTGKELIARSIHELSRRNIYSFEAINCATLNSELLSSELFGHVKGAFTGAVQNKEGLFRVADKGTLFLDEIGEMPSDLQARFLRVLQERTFIPVGSTQSVKVDVRIISATHQSLRALVAKGLFREDLMYRIRVVPLFLPSLVERGGDVEALTWYFIEEENKKGMRTIREIEKSAMEAILDYSWPGNVRELRNNIEYAFAVGEGEVLKLSQLTPELQGIGAPVLELDIERKSEKDRILSALNEARGKKSVAAELLGMSRSTLWRKLREYKLTQ